MKISVIVPALNEAGIIRSSLESLRKHSPDEIILADGGSKDQTRSLASDLVDHVATTHPGRARQMNEGARYATGEILLFLHADTQLPINALQIIRAAFLSNDEMVGGRFRISFDHSGLRYKLISFYTKFPMFSYGDQAFFVRRSAFEALSGFDEAALFEDVEFYRRLRRFGVTQILRQCVVTSARRFEQTGFIKQKFINIVLSLMVSAGLNPRPLAQKIYPEIR